MNELKIVGGEHGFPKKPAPDAALYLAEKYKKDGFSPIFIGDSSVDMQTAANAGFDACGVLWGFRDRVELEQYRPKFLAENAEELREIILGE
ncbi:MAG: HAD family hydrolase [Oscillospiraceae bacterium]